MISVVTATVDSGVPHSHGSALSRSLPDCGAALTCQMARGADSSDWTVSGSASGLLARYLTYRNDTSPRMVITKPIREVVSGSFPMEYR